MPEDITPNATQVDAMGTPVAPPPIGGTTAPGLVSGVTGQGEVQKGTEPGTPAVPAGEPASTPQVQPQTQEFFDPKDLPPEMQPIFKSMQASYTKRMQQLSGERQKVEAYNNFMADPVGNIQQLARQYGMEMTRAQAGAMAHQAGVPQHQAATSEPQTWDEVYATAEQRAEERIMLKLAPILQNVQKMQATTIEVQLNELDPMWREHEPRMREILAKHPTMVQDVEDLYTLAAKDHLASRAVQQAMKKMQTKVEGARVAGASSARSTPAPKEVKSFNDAVAAAKEALASRG